jgi:hypothetical protein
VGAAEVLLGGLLVAVAVLAALARLLAVPYPIVLVVGGAVIGFVPGLPHVQLDPDVVLLIFLPPLLYWAAVSANFLTFGVILATLVAQGLTLPALIRLLGVSDEQAEQREELRARLAATRAALAHIDLLAEQEWTRGDSVERLRNAYEFHMRRLKARAGKIADDEGYEDKSLAYQYMVRAVLTTQRATVIELRDQGTVSNDVMNRVIQDFDLEETRLEI